MNTNKLICLNCSYSENLSTATKCELCGMSLRSTKNEGLPRQESSSQKEANNAKNKVVTQKRLKFVLLGLAIGLVMGIAGSLILRERNNNKDTVEIQPEETVVEDNVSPESEPSLAEIKNVPNGLFWYGSSIPFSPLHTTQISNEITQALPGFKTRYKEPPAYTKPGSSTSIAMLLDGMVSFAELSRPLRDLEYQKAKERGISLQQIPIASDGIVFFVNPSLPVDRLTINQVRKMILGEITNWQQVGGPDLLVVPFVFDPKIAPSTLLLLFEEPELEQFGDDARYVRDYTDAIRKVSATPGGISYASAAIIANQRSVKPLLLARGDSSDYVNPFTKQRKINTQELQNGNYPLMRRFFIGVRRDGTIDERAGLAYANIWLSEPGQKLVEKAGFVPIKNPDN